MGMHKVLSLIKAKEVGSQAVYVVIAVDRVIGAFIIIEDHQNRVNDVVICYGTCADRCGYVQQCA